MRPIPQVFVLVASLLLGTGLRAQEPERTREPQPAALQPAAPTPEVPPADEPADEAEPQDEPLVLAIRAAHVHPVSGPDIQDGVVLIRGDRITAVGNSKDIEVPANATSLTFADGHVYPGLVDASTDAFTDDALRSDGSLDAGSAIVDGLRRRLDREDELVRAGITTAYVSGRGMPWSGQGAVVRPKRDRVLPWPGRERAAVGLRLAANANDTHALQRLQQIDAAFRAFEGLDDYQKKIAAHEQDLEKYRKDFAAWIAWHEKKNGKGEGKPAGETAGAPAAAGTEGAAGPRPGGRGGRGRRGGPPGGNDGTPAPAQPTPGESKPADGPAAEPKPAEPKAADPKAADPKATDPKGDSKPADDKPPERPQYPKPPARDPQKDTLLAVLDGKMPLRAEVTRPDEIRRTIAAARERKVPVLVLEHVLAGGKLADELAAAAVPCVLTNVWPEPPAEALRAFDACALPAALERSGVAFAIASGSARRAFALRLAAASAIGHGLPEKAALRAITLTPAEILGVQKDTGSLQVGKLADLLVCDRPLFASDCKVLAVFASGENQLEANPR